MFVGEAVVGGGEAHRGTVLERNRVDGPSWAESEPMSGKEHALHGGQRISLGASSSRASGREGARPGRGSRTRSDKRPPDSAWFR
jgi:hypothetical protein